MAGRDINNNIDNEINEKVKERLSSKFNWFYFNSEPITIKLLYYSCACAFLEYVKQLIERNRDRIKLMIVALNDIKNLAIYEDKETFKKEFLNIVFSKYKPDIYELFLLADLRLLGTNFRYEDVVKMSAEVFIEMLLTRSLEEEGSNYKFNVYKFLFSPGYIYDISDRFLFFRGITNKEFVELYKKFFINIVELADVVVDVFKLRIYVSETLSGRKYYIIGNKELNIYLPIKSFGKNSYQGKKYENLLKKLSVVLSMFYETESFFEPDSDLVFDFDLEYFKKEILYKKTKNNEKFISELSAKLDSVINKLKENSKN